ncbi:SAG family member [Eimeria necatrix]|uniref:SAG family member n=1 Tax=Eimeria necatrix TaxID=51315 RepID=U6MD92_9EIME|nr:SAG family member [Eimeria necatrix]CDJ62192.1 SAG family member [Eimeria necatrix]
MPRIGLLACYAGLLAGAAIPNSSAAVPIRSASVNPHHGSPDIKAPSLAQLGTAPAADDVTNECLPVLNALRTEGLDGLLSELVKASSEEVRSSLSPQTKSESDKKTTVVEIAQELAGENKENCEAADANTSKYSGLVITFQHSTAFDCEALIKESFAAGLSHLQQESYETSSATNKLGTAPLDNPAAKNLAAIVSTKAGKVSCAATTDCAAGSNVLFCYFIEPLAVDEAQPIKAEVYEALLKRQRGLAPITIPGITATLFSLALIMLS